MRFGYCPNEKAWRRHMKALKLKEPYPSNDGSITRFEKDGVVHCIMTINASQERTGVEIVGLIVHESMHIWQEVLSYMQEREPSSEFEAYSVQAIVQGLLEAYTQVHGKVICKPL